jgi:GDP-L-fucose synthase
MILVTGATGFLGKRICRRLESMGIAYHPTSLSLGLDLRNQQEVLDFFSEIKPTYILNCAAYFGGIQFGYKYPAEIFTFNLQMTINLMEASKQFGVKRIVNPVSNCSYPGEASVFREEEYWNGPLHESVMVFGFVRKASWVGAWAYSKQYDLDVLNLVLPNLYGPEDHFEEERSHALGALIMKMVEAKKKNLSEVIVWGSGKPLREWLHIDEAAEAMIRGLNAARCLEIINIGVGCGISIAEMAYLIKECVGYEGALRFDTSKPDGAPSKIIDGSRGIELLDWSPKKDFKCGIQETINWYKRQN